MTKDEELLIFVMSKTEDRTYRAIVLQSYISEVGPLSEHAAAEVRKLLAKTPLTK